MTGFSTKLRLKTSISSMSFNGGLAVLETIHSVIDS